jgi:hypothetical protein
MSYSKLLSFACVVVLSLAVCAADASAQSRRGGGSRGPAVGHSAPRGPVAGGSRAVNPGRYYGGGYLRPRYITPRILGFSPYRPYYYPYRPGITLGFYAGFGYPYPYGYYGYPYGYPYASDPYYGSAYGYGYSMPPAGYVSARPGAVYGGVRIEGAPKDAQVFADGYYVGLVEDFDGPVRHLNLEAGAHQIEIRPVNGEQPIAFDVNVQGGQTISVHADVR